MQTQFLQHPAMGLDTQKLCEYLLVVNPAAGVNEQLMEEKQQFYNIYKEEVAIKTKPHITIANFLAKEAMEETIIRYMHRIISARKSFVAMLNNFSGFPAHTIYVRVQNHSPFKRLLKELKVIDLYICGNGCPPAHFISNPHVTIARRLEKEVYDKAMIDYSKRSFHALFIVNELVLLKRRTQFDKCKQVNVFKLMPGDEHELFDYAEMIKVEQGKMEFE